MSTGYLILIVPMHGNPASDMPKRCESDAELNIACECRGLTLGDDPARDADAAILTRDGMVCAVVFRS